MRGTYTSPSLLSAVRQNRPSASFYKRQPVNATPLRPGPATHARSSRCRHPECTRSMKLLLFDIDGTLLLTHGVGRMAVEESLRRVLGETIPSDGISFSGKTDPQIFREILAH